MKVLKHLLISGFIASFGMSSVQADLSEYKSSEQIKIGAGSSRARGSEIYLVKLKGDPVIAYNGDMAGFAATRPGRGEKMNPNSASVKKYAGHLIARQNEVMASVGAEKVYNYRYAFNGFAARMSAADAKALSKHPDVARVMKDEKHTIDTNTSPQWIGVTQQGGAWYKGYTGEDVVVASIDTGIWPEHPSFLDVRTPILGNFGPKLALDGIPAGFSSSGCDLGTETNGGSGTGGGFNHEVDTTPNIFTCNKKLLAARCFNAGLSTGSDASNPCGGNGVFVHPDDFQSARDYDGHGSHTIATAAGNYGVSAFIDGERLGKVTGIAPRARVATYKVCWDGADPDDTGCYTSDNTAAVDQAVADGADVINYSVGGSSTFFGGSTNEAYLWAADAGVFVATSNGNSGSAPETTGTPAGVSWITSVGATQDDGVFNSTIVANTPPSLAGEYIAVEGDGDVSLEDTGVIMEDVVLAMDATGVATDACEALTNGADVDGNIALVIRGGCAFTDKYNNAAAAGAVAIVVYNDGTDPSRFDPFGMSAPGVTIPGVMVGFGDGDAMANAAGVNATLDPDNAVSAANRIAGFSSRGPNAGMRDVIKPDVSAPGVNILAAGTPAQTGENFMSISGTSMASPHAAGAFALIKQKHPDWSAAQAKSALMTTGRQNLNKTFGDDAADPFDIGSGEIIPTDALNPGLTFDTDFYGHLLALCGEPAQSGVGDSFFGFGVCDFLEDVGEDTDPSNLNLASIGIADLLYTQTVTRTVTNATKGKRNRNSTKTFKAYVDAPPGIEVLLSDWELELRGGESATYDITFTTERDAVIGEWAFGAITWVEQSNKPVKRSSASSGGNAQVRSTVAVRPTAILAAEEVDGSGTSGSVDVPVFFGYTGDYSAEVSGIQASVSDSGTLPQGFYTSYCLPNGFFSEATHVRFATFDDDVGYPGIDDLDLQVYGAIGCSVGERTSVLGSSGGFTSEEVVDVPNPDGQIIQVWVINYFGAVGDVDYTLWIQDVYGDNDNTSVDAPSSVSANSSDNVTVDYEGLDPTRGLGILHHIDGNGNEAGRTILDIDARSDDD